MADKNFVRDERKSSLPLLAGVSGNLMEWYDFGLYGVLAPTLGRLFFPNADGFLGLLSVYGVFAAGYIARVAGGTVFGHVGDLVGRRSALLLSALVMAVATFLVGCLPTYASVGLAAPVLLTLFRLFQGLSAGGEFAASLTYTIEHAPRKRRALHGSFAAMSATAGILLGSGTGSLLFSIFSEEQILQWAWRGPFLLSLPMGILIVLLRRVLPADMPPETDHSKSLPLVRVFRNHPGLIVRGALLGWGPSAGFYLSAVFISSFLTDGHLLDQRDALITQTLAIFVIFLCMPIAGFLADQVGRRKMVLASLVATALFGLPLFLLLERGNQVVDLLATGTFAVLLAVGFSPFQVWLAEQFPTDLRASGFGISYNVAAGVFGGTTPLLATALVEFTGSPLAPAALIIGTSIISLAAAFSLPETADKPLR
jgi:MHS family proline/betaine transporter-like MFS transporter